ncbi:MAG: hypothetical protein ICV83_15545, partial [Cytophagales bacterium]|nr:hypothetical protein [Cytophagales bacterium]
YMFTYNHRISYGDGVQQPRLSLLLNPTITLGGGLSDTAIFNNDSTRYFTALQPGRASFIPALSVSGFVDRDAQKDVEVFAFVNAGLKFFPVLEATDVKKNIMKGYPQWLVGAGGGIKFKSYLTVDASFLRAGYDFSSYTRRYFENNFDTVPFFRSIQANAKVYIINKKTKYWFHKKDRFPKNTDIQIYGFVSWQGYYRSYANQKFYTAGLGIVVEGKPKTVEKPKTGESSESK